jgi:hypothetical protein
VLVRRTDLPVGSSIRPDDHQQVRSDGSEDQAAREPDQLECKTVSRRLRAFDEDRHRDHRPWDATPGDLLGSKIGPEDRSLDG